MHEKHIFLRVFSKITIFACVFCAFFISPVFATLPSGYTQLEYIQNNKFFADTRINTGLTFAETTKIELGMEINSYATYNNIFITGGTNGVSAPYIAIDKQNRITANSLDNPVTSYSDNVITVSYTTDSANTLNISGWSDNAYTGTYKYNYVKIYNNTVLVRNFIPARRNSDNVVGMYDIANSGKNLWTIDNYYGNGYWDTNKIPQWKAGGSYWCFDVPVKENTDYTMYYYNKNSWAGYVTFWDKNKNKVGQTNIGNTQERHMTTPAGCVLVSIVVTSNTYATDKIQLEEGATVTSYESYPFYTNAGTGTFVAGPEKSISEIKIATTKFVDDEFKAAEAKLAATVQTIESVVSRTITQTGQIQVLQDTKQTRPDESCPANMKCLLVQDEDGTPHWYPIIEP